MPSLWELVPVNNTWFFVGLNLLNASLFHWQAPGTKAFSAYEKYKCATSLEEAKRLGATAKSLAWDLQRNHPLPIADGGQDTRQMSSALWQISLRQISSSKLSLAGTLLAKQQLRVTPWIPLMSKKSYVPISSNWLSMKSFWNRNTCHTKSLQLPCISCPRCQAKLPLTLQKTCRVGRWRVLSWFWP